MKIKKQVEREIHQIRLPLDPDGEDLAGNEDEQQEKVGRGKRSLELIADFKDGYAVGWHFAVRECFKDQLDIKQTERKVPLIGKDGKEVMVSDTDENGKPKLDENGKPKMKVQKVARLFWTQGKCCTFSQGDTFYDTPKAYELVWKEALKHIGKCCRIVQAAPDTPDFKAGSVTFTLTKPKEDGTGLEAEGERYELSQAEFVEFLRTGNLSD